MPRRLFALMVFFFSSRRRHTRCASSKVAAPRLGRPAFVMTESVGATPIIAESRAEPAFGVTDVLLFAMAMIWGINFVVVKYATHIFNPVAFTGLRVGTVAVFLVIFALTRGKQKAGSGWRLPVSQRDLWRLLALGVLGNGLYQLFFVLG